MALAIDRSGPVGGGVSADSPRGARRLAWGLGAAAGLVVLLTLGDPGITVDEPLDVRPGRKYVELALRHGLGFFTPEVIDRTYRDNAEHPPLGRWLLGLASKAGEPFEILIRGGDPTGLFVRSGRIAPALSYALLVGRVALEGARLGGLAGGVGAGLGLFLMPRMFAHAHLGALDTFVALFWTLALLATIRATDRRSPLIALTWAGVLWGLALLTKIHGWLLVPVALVWIGTRLGLRRGEWGRAVLGFTLWLGAGLGVFALGWPWLWFDTIGRLAAYFGTGVERSPILVQYFGIVYRDIEVPWHYPWIYAVATVPVGLLTLGVVGVMVSWLDRASRPWLLMLGGVIAGWVLLFSTRVPVYDGERLFLPVFPAMAIVVGSGFAWCWNRLAGWRWGRLALAAGMAAQAYGLVAVHPFGLSYYNAMVGGLAGAERLGLELTYWGDAVDERLLNRLVREADSGDRAALAPTLAPMQGLTLTTPALARREIFLGDQEVAEGAKWIVVYRRSAYWSREIRRLVESRPPVAIRERQGVWLSGIWKITGKMDGTN